MSADNTVAAACIPELLQGSSSTPVDDSANIPPTKGACPTVLQHVDATVPDVTRSSSTSMGASSATPNSTNIAAQQLPPSARQRYTRVRVIGQGANGTAWLCTDNNFNNGTSTQRYVVVKCFAVPQISSQGRNLIQNEITCLSTARHPNIISFYEASLEDVSNPPHGSAEAMAMLAEGYSGPLSAGGPAPPVLGKQLIVMEFADAGDLRRIVKLRRKPIIIPAQQQQDQQQESLPQQSSPLQQQLQPRYAIDPNAFFTARDVMFLFVQIAMALHHCHINSILHRDIKTANIMMCSNGLVKLGDFGLSRRYEKPPAASDTSPASTQNESNQQQHQPLDVSSATSIAQTFCGTPCYLAPELWKGQKYGKSADIWGLGIVLYEMVTLGCRPFNGDSVHVLANRIVSGVYDPLPGQGEFGSNSVDDGIRTLVGQLLDVDPARRPSTSAIFQIPYVRKCLTELSIAMKKNPAVPPETLSAWQHEANKLLQLPVQLAQLPVLPETHGGFVRRYVASAVPAQWILHELRLVRWGAALVLATVVQQPPAVNYFPSPPQPEPQQTKEIPTHQLNSVMVIPAESSFGIPGVFAVTTNDGRCTWFQAQSDLEQKQWVRLLRNAITAASALSASGK